MLLCCKRHKLLNKQFRCRWFELSVEISWHVTSLLQNYLINCHGITCRGTGLVTAGNVCPGKNSKLDQNEAIKLKCRLTKYSWKRGWLDPRCERHLLGILKTSNIQIHRTIKNTNHFLVSTRLETYVNSSAPNAAYMLQGTGSVLVQVMACRLLGVKPLHEPTLI